FSTREWGLAAIGPGKVLSAVVCTENDNRVVIQSAVLEMLHDIANDVVELSHAGFLNRPAILWCAHLFILVREMRDDVHSRWVKPYEERLAILFRLVDKFQRIREDFIVNGLHPIRAQRTGVLDFLLADFAPSRLIRGI